MIRRMCAMVKTLDTAPGEASPRITLNVRFKE